MQAPLSTPREQTFDEIYGPPENFLEIEVRLYADSSIFAKLGGWL